MKLNYWEKRGLLIITSPEEKKQEKTIKKELEDEIEIFNELENIYQKFINH